MDQDQEDQFARLRQLVSRGPFEDDPPPTPIAARARAATTGTATATTTTEEDESLTDAEDLDRGEVSPTAAERRLKRRREAATRAELEREYTLEEQRWDLEQNAEAIDALEAKIREVEEREESRRAEKEMKLLRKQREVQQHNHDFRANNAGWLREVSGILGMDSSEELVQVPDSGMYRLTAQIRTARDHAVAFIGRLVGDEVVTFDGLKTEHAFLRLIALFYLKFNSFCAVLHGMQQKIGPSLQKDMDRQMYLILATKFKLTPVEISERVLGELAHCGRPCSC